MLPLIRKSVPFCLPGIAARAIALTSLLAIFPSCSDERSYSPPAWIHGTWSDGKRDRIRFTSDAITEAPDSTEDYYSGIDQPLTDSQFSDSLYYVFTNDDYYLAKYMRIDQRRMKRITVYHRKEIDSKVTETLFTRIR
jgi:hypothetical protein